MTQINHKKIKLNEILLLSIAGVLDFLTDIKDPFGLYSNYYKNFYGYIPNRWKQQNYYRLVKKQINDKTIKEISIGNEYYLKITTDGINKLNKKFGLNTLSSKPWDGIWRIVIFDIQELRKYLRNAFRRKLKYLGFGPIQKSVWVSPYPAFKEIEAFIKANDLNNEIVVLESQKIGLDIEELLNKAWGLNEFKKLYLSYYKSLIQIKTQIKATGIKSVEKEFKNIHRKVLDLYFNDPRLPSELLPKDWPRFKTMELLKDITKRFYK